jgi:dihydrofolate reductase
MGQVVLIMTASIDGYVVRPDGMAVGAMPEPPQLKRWKLDRISRAGMHIMGRVTYEEMRTFWPMSKDPYAAPINDIPKVVFSKTLKEADWPESTIASGVLAKEITALRNKRGGEIIAWGGARFAQALARQPHQRVRADYQPGCLRRRQASVLRSTPSAGTQVAGHHQLRKQPRAAALSAQRWSRRLCPAN